MRLLLLVSILMLPCVPCLRAESLVSPDATLEAVKEDFQLVDGASANAQTLFVPDVRGKKLYVYRPGTKSKEWQVIDEGSGYSGSFCQLGKIYLADNANARILCMAATNFQSQKPEVLASFDDGARPNDLVVDVLGNVYVTLTKQGEIRRIQPDGGIQTVAEGIESPNGITLSPDGRRLYVSAYRTGQIYQFQIGYDSNQLTNRRVLAEITSDGDGPMADGMCVDRAGNVYCAGADAVWVWDPAGNLLEKIKTPARPINCTFGGQHGRQLYISTFDGLYRLHMNTYGVQPNPAVAGELANLSGKPSTEIPDEVEARFNQEYYRVGTRRLHCDLFTPQTDEAGRPAIVLVHGGGWLQGDKNKFRALAIKLAQQGYVVMNIEYRLGHEAHFPAGIRDCNAAVRFLRSHASLYNVDPDRIAAVGGSAGGHLVGLMATGSEHQELQPVGEVQLIGNAQPSLSSRLAAAVVMAGPMQIASGSVAERSHSGQTSNATQWLGKNIDEAPLLYDQADAFQKISSDAPPLLFLTGSLDNPDRDLPSIQKFKSAGVTARQVVHEDAKHGHWNRTEWIDQVVLDIHQFLKSHL